MDDNPKKEMNVYPHKEMDDNPTKEMNVYPHKEMDDNPKKEMDDYPKKEMDDYPKKNIVERVLEEWVDKLEEDENLEPGLLETREEVSKKQSIRLDTHTQRLVEKCV